MKRNLPVILIAVTASLLTFIAMGQAATKPKTDRSDYSRHESSQDRRTDRLNSAAKASELIGMEVKNYQDEDLGEVQDLVVDMESGRVVQVILSSGGFLGIGSLLTPVPPGALHHDTADQVLLLKADRAKLESSPTFDANKWAESSNSTNLAATYRHYGEESALNFIGLGETRRDDQRNQTDQATDSHNHVQPQDPFRSDSTTRAMIPEERLAKLQRAIEIISMTVENQQDEILGEVENILVDLSSGRLVAVVLSSGELLGLGGELSAVPPTALQFSEDREGLRLNATKEMLSRAPHFKANQWPDFSKPDQAGSVYNAFEIEPYFDATPEADNTQRNMRDRNNRTLTPLNQGNSQADLTTTASIRKEIAKSDHMSVNAGNIKIITRDGQVTLRGSVNSDEEKRLIGEIANRIVRAANVDNQLEVALTPNRN